ncbi:ubiquitin carboxyl-terminal hydrolase 48 [Octopus bimaculoides]|uniref:ubiquitin carboxyl-terminal hydrolase 48 n=1 Tax=Octopus bimaculoides TaxID=37653 RepID=UPI00071E614B|nr:ubiquitin carboxyl-terminal hydrolase 48 [Octopus bimaculoides]|eukprot:XP_014778290.1 PREDICTED: ubiquitin carboxyl-terminal hydrolase 48-like [Octopus bimaculoides]
MCFVGMPSKQQLDKEAWGWIETTDPDQVTLEHVKYAYHINLEPCKLGSCKILWFHNQQVRKAVYQWRSREEQPPNSPTDSDWTPSTICGHLQLIFALLQFSKQRYIDPSNFIKHLGLNTAQQQDAQEFSKLFLSLLEETLMQSDNPNIKNVIEEQFSGEYAYITCWLLQEEKLEGDNKYMCSHCKTKQNAIRTIQLQKLPPVLNLQLLRFVFDKQNGQKKKLNNYIQFPEVLDMTEYLKDSGADGSKPVVYDLSAVLIHRGISAYSGHYIAHIKDRTSQAWYKFNDEETERMQGRNLHLGNEEEVHIQESSSSTNKSKAPRLTKGYHSSRNAYMLVYIKRLSEDKTANSSESEKVSEELLPKHVRDYVLMDNKRFENWIQELLNMRDQSVEIGRERQEEIKYVYYSLVPKGNVLNMFEWLSLDWLSRWLTDPIKAPSINNQSFLCCHSRYSLLGTFFSLSAAALFAKFMGGPRLLGEESLCMVCVQKQCHVMRMKQKMEKDMKYITNIMKYNHDSVLHYFIILAMKAVHRLRGDCPSDNSNKWSEETGFNNDLLCTPHRALNPEVNCRRLVPRDVWEILRSYFPKCPEFQRDVAVCAKCVLQSQVEQQNIDQKKEWALQQKAALPDLYHDRNRPNVRNIKSHVHVVGVNFVEEWRRAVKDPIRRSPVITVRNSALICVHGGMLYEPDLNAVALASQCITYLWPEEWTFIEASCTVDIEITVHKQSAQPDDGQPVFVCKPAVCQDCFLSRLQQEEQQRFEYTGAKIYVRKVLKDWQQLKTTMGYTNLCTTTTTPNATPTVAAALAARSVDDSDPKDLDFQAGGKRLKVAPSTDVTTTNTTTITNSTASNTTATTTNNIVNSMGATTTTTTTTTTNTTANTSTTTTTTATEATVITTTTTATTTTSSTSVPGASLLSSSSSLSSSLSSSTSLSSSLPAGDGAKLTTSVDNSVRRSHRHRRMRGEKEVVVSSTDTLRDLKLQIMKLFSVPPFDQNLHFNGTCLLDETATLGQLRISPGCLIFLKADEPSEDPMVVEEILTTSNYGEEGFKGTGLLSG